MVRKELTYYELNPCILDVGLQGSDSWRTTPRRIYDHELMFCIKGRAHARIDGVEYVLEEGGALLIPPGSEHLFWQMRPEENEIIFLHFDYVCDEKSPQIQAYYENPRLYLELYASRLQQTDLMRNEVVFIDGRQIPRYQKVKNPEKLKVLLEELQGIFYQEEQGLQEKILLLSILEELLQNGGGDGVPVPTPLTKQTRRVRLMLEVIRTRYFEPLRVEDIVEPTGLNEDYASRLFKQVTDHKIVDFLNLHRLRQAQILLLDQDLAISEVAEMVGFKTHSYFVTVTRRYFGVTPTELRTRSLANLGLPEID